jgi:hypothetical protein
MVRILKHINYNIFLQHYEGKVQVGLLDMRQQTLLQPKERFNVHLFQDSMM